MKHFANKVLELTPDLHQGCGGTIVFEGVPVNYDVNYAVSFREKMRSGFFDFVFVPPLGAACITSYGAVHLLTRTRSRYKDTINIL